MLNNKKILIIFLVGSFFFSGCASISRSRLSNKAFSLNGDNYILLSDLYSSYNIDYKYDSFAQTVTLRKEANEAKFLTDNPVVLINGKFGAK